MRLTRTAALFAALAPLAAPPAVSAQTGPAWAATHLPPDVLAMVGFGAACEAISQRLDARLPLLALRERAEHGLRRLGFVINAADSPRAATVVNASLLGARGPELVAALDLEGVCVSSGAACSSGLAAPSPVLLAMHADAPARASSALRLSFGPETTTDDVDFALKALAKVLARSAAPKN